MKKVLLTAIGAAPLFGARDRSDQNSNPKSKVGALNEAKVISFTRLPFLVLILIILGFGFPVPTKADPPARIGRINYLNGSVSFQRGDLDEWVGASVNYPMTAGDRLWADDNSRAELHVGSTVIRLSNDTDFSFLNMDDDVVQVRLSQGSLIIRVRNLGDYESFEIDTPNAAVSLLRPGAYRIDVDNDGNTNITVRDGEAEVASAGYEFTVYEQEEAIVYGLDDPTYDIGAEPRADAFENWSLDRDRREERAASVHYVSREMVGYEDLDQYGRWQNISGYGNVWTPTAIAAGWTPYHDGHWVWIEPWGWTWVDDAPWGFAPFHYGRWANVNNTWYWVPGDNSARPVYAPALVAFVGGNNWSLSLSSGERNEGIGWFPLAPNEVYVPAYHVSQNYVRNVNVTNVNVTNINITNYNVSNVNYVNRSIPGALVVVPQQAFQSGRAVAAVAIKATPQEVTASRVVGIAAVAPTRQSLVVENNITTNNKNAAVAKPPAAIQNRPVVAKIAPPPPPVQFAARQQALAANQGKPLDEGTIVKIRQNAPAAQAAARPNIKPAAPPASVNNGAPSVTLRPARQGLPPAQPATVQGYSKPGAGRAEAPVNNRPANRQGRDNNDKVDRKETTQQPAGQPEKGNNPATRPIDRPSRVQQPIQPAQKQEPTPDQPQGQFPERDRKSRAEQPQPRQQPNTDAKPNSKANPENPNLPNRPKPPQEEPAQPKPIPNDEAKPRRSDRQAKPKDDAQPQQEPEKSRDPSKVKPKPQEEPAQPKPVPNDEAKPRRSDRQAKPKDDAQPQQEPEKGRDPSKVAKPRQKPKPTPKSEEKPEEKPEDQKNDR